MYVKFKNYIIIKKSTKCSSSQREATSSFKQHGYCHSCAKWTVFTYCTAVEQTERKLPTNYFNQFCKTAEMSFGVIRSRDLHGKAEASNKNGTQECCVYLHIRPLQPLQGSRNKCISSLHTKKKLPPASRRLVSVLRTRLEMYPPPPECGPSPLTPLGNSTVTRLRSGEYYNVWAY